MENKLPKRKPTRLKKYDYSTPGTYFITICAHERKCVFSSIVGEGLCALPSINLTPIGKDIENAINYINFNYTNIAVNKYVIMPNHIHMILEIKTGGDGTPPLQIYDIVGRLKSYVTRNYDCKIFQRSFYEHIIRGQTDYDEISTYIDNNPLKWHLDKLYIKNKNSL